MPVQTGRFYALDELLLVRVPQGAAWTQKVTVHNDSPDDMESVQSGHCEINREIGADAGIVPMRELVEILVTFYREEE